jgi:hypothetical protein
MRFTMLLRLTSGPTCEPIARLAVGPILLHAAMRLATAHAIHELCHHAVMRLATAHAIHELCHHTGDVTPHCNVSRNGIGEQMPSHTVDTYEF